jgi:6-phosphogluconolactonase
MAGMTPQVIVSETPEALADRIAEDFEALIKETLAQKDRVTIALSGGQTPKQFYSRLAQEPFRGRIPWEKLWFFWSDERCVPMDHPDSNFRMVSETLLKEVPVRPSHVFRMRGEDAPPQAARDYEKVLREIFPDAEWPPIDLMFLGLGPDGHTASLMPATPALNLSGAPNDRWVVGNVIRSMQTVRITFTLPAINHARHVWFLVTGAKKAKIFAQVRQAENVDYPASLIKPESGDLRWYVDKAVISGIMPSSPAVSGGGPTTHNRFPASGSGE